MSNRSCETIRPEVGGATALCLRGRDLTMGEVHSVAAENRAVKITDDPSVLERVRAAESLVEDAVNSGRRVYGLNTGFGSMAGTTVPPDALEDSQVNLLSFLSAGAGRPIDGTHVRAAMLLRANMLLRGASGVRLEIVERFVRFLNAGATPIVGELGSIGASGDLVPLAVIARAVTGEATPCRVRMPDGECDSRDVLEKLGLEPLRLRPKEGLAIVNGTSFSSAIGLNCLHASRNFLGLALASHAMMLRALLGHEEPFDSFVHRSKPHPGQVRAAEIVRRLLGSTGDADSSGSEGARAQVQDRYSLRCLAQYMGPVLEGMDRAERVLTTEANGVTDNPLVDVEADRFLESGNFLGQYVGMAMDDLRRYLGLMAKHLDVQIALLVSPEFNRGLPASLSGNGDSSVDMHLKGLQIVGNSIVPMLIHLGNPLVEHYPTHAEQFNQNVNGLCWGAANLASRSVEFYAHYAAVSLIFAVQAIDLRARALEDHCDGRSLLSPRVIPLYEAVYECAGERPGSRTPFVGNHVGSSLEDLVAGLTASIRENGAPVEAVADIVGGLGEGEAGRRGKENRGK